MKFLGRAIWDWALCLFLMAVLIALVWNGQWPMATCVAMVTGVMLGITQPHVDDL